MQKKEWHDLARKVNWNPTFVPETKIFPHLHSGRPWLPGKDWAGWDEPFRTTFSEYVRQQHKKNVAVEAVRGLLSDPDYIRSLPMVWLNALKLYSAVFSLAEFAAVIGNLRAMRFGRDSAWRHMATFGALDELRHTQIPLKVMQCFLPVDGQFDWTHRFYHTKNWVSIAARHFADELLLTSDPIEFAVGTNFVFETGFTNLQFVGLSATAHEVGDNLFEAMIKSIQTDEARHAQIGPAVLAVLARKDSTYAQYLLDKWFWRSWLLFSVVTGISMDYLTPLKARSLSFKEFMNEWILEQFLLSLDRFGLKKPWYWDQFLQSIDHYHHMVYLSAYSYRATVWFDMVVPSPEERQWLLEKYPESFAGLSGNWKHVDQQWQKADPGNDFAVQSSSIIGFCNLCQLVLAGGTPESNCANVLDFEGQRYIFCSEPCRWIFLKEPERYRSHLDIVKRVLKGEAPGNVISLVRNYFDLDYDTWGKDARGGCYPWINRKA